ncbi:MAG: hypothetical protein ABI140_21290 [Jatrophihabitantaceae bacterium]
MARTAPLASLGSLVCLVGLAGCTSANSSPSAADQAGPASTTSTAGSKAATKPATSAPAVRTSSHQPAPATSISIPPNLCAATDIAQNTADAYMGALSAGNEKEARACVFGTSVPLATTRSLLGHTAETAVYLPKQGGADGPAKFDYVGAGKSITVTVSRLSDHHTWVTGVTVHSP